MPEGLRRFCMEYVSSSEPRFRATSRNIASFKITATRMRVLIIGGTIFAGRHVAAAFLARGHDVTLFNRAQTAPALFPELERITGDRKTDIERIGERRFDAVIDTCGYLPHDVSASASYLAPRAERYLFISSVSAYQPGHVAGDESAPLEELPDGASATEFANENYGALKVLCERAASAAFGAERTIVVRPGLIVGPNDPTDRFSYWPQRIARGGEVLAPGRASDPMQFIDVRDLAQWMVALLEAGECGAFNAVSPPRAFTFGDVFAACTLAARSDARPVWVESSFLEAHDVEPWMGLPLWLPESAGFAGFFDVGAARAQATGLRMRPLVDTARDTLAWLATLPADREWKAGLAPEREVELLSAWAAKDSV
jgi:2'-hydroxyisoflavone reductase